MRNCSWHHIMFTRTWVLKIEVQCYVALVDCLVWLKKPCKLFRGMGNNFIIFHNYFQDCALNEKKLSKIKHFYSENASKGCFNRWMSCKNLHCPEEIWISELLWDGYNCCYKHWDQRLGLRLLLEWSRSLFNHGFTLSTGHMQIFNFTYTNVDIYYC